MKGLLIAAVVCFSGVAFANEGTYEKDKNVATTKSENANALTASDQGQTQSDTDRTRSIRQRIHQDDSISMMGKNVTIISKGGAVTLKGTVSSMEEKTKINRIAADVAGAAVTDQLTIKK